LSAVLPADRVSFDLCVAAAVVLQLDADRDASAKHIALIGATLKPRDCNADAHCINVGVGDLPSDWRCLKNLYVDAFDVFSRLTKLGNIGLRVGAIPSLNGDTFEVVIRFRKICYISARSQDWAYQLDKHP
jgi:hypothetical protein